MIKSVPLEDKVIEDGKVAVLISPNYGAGWYSWNIHNTEYPDKCRCGKWHLGNVGRPLTHLFALVAQQLGKVNT